MKIFPLLLLFFVHSASAETDSASGSPGRLGLLKKLFGIYSRTEVTDTSLFPYRVIGQLDDGCSATIIGPKHLLTAAHCVYNFKEHAWNENLDFFPGRTKAGVAPYGSFRWKKVMLKEEYIETGSNEHDFAVIETLEEVGTTLGWSGFKVLQKNELTNQVRITGYPGDKPSGTMWTVTCPFSLEKTTIHYQCDTYGGMSGSGVFSIEKDPNSFFIVGVHTFGGEILNGGVILDAENFKLIQEWRNNSVDSENTLVNENRTFKTK